MSTTTSTCGSTGPKVVHCKRAPRGSYVYIGRPSRFGNPFRLSDPTDDRERDRVIVRYAEYFQTRIARDLEFRRAVESLRGRDLGCWCAPRRCHGEIILAWLATHPPEGTRCSA
jgi:Domain of unknown function (DUF4326)